MYLCEEETGAECFIHTESEVTVDGYVIELFIEETRMLYPYGAFIKGVGSCYGECFEEATQNVLATAKAM